MTEMSDKQTISDKLEQMEDKDTEEGEILEDGEIADEDENSSSDNAHKGDEHKGSEEKENNREKDSNNKDRDSRRRDSEKDRKSEDRVRDKDRDRRERERERRHGYDRPERTDRASRERKSSESDRERDRKTAVSTADDERRRRERERKRRRSDEEDRDERLRDDKRKRSRDQNNWNEFNETNNRNNIEEYERQRFEDFDFRQPEPHFPPNAGPIHSDDEDLNFDDRDFEEMMQIMEHNMPSNRVRAMDGSEKRAMMKAMALMMKRNLDLSSDKGRRLARLRDKRRVSERTPGPTGTRAVIRPPERPERQSGFKQICKFFLDGKCHKGNDCPFSHEALPPKKKDLCKFYLQGFCGKGEDCLFMHSEFPCKFFHTNVECYSGDNCRFSHQPLNEETREILRNYLDSGQLPDDPKPDRNKQNDNKINNKSDNNYNKSQTNSETQNQTQSQMSSAVQSAPTYAPLKPVAKRHAILGDATHEMKSSHFTWIWQQEMKELEVAYVGNKRNLFCIEKPFVLSEKPSTPRMEDDEEEIEEQIRNYYRDAMPEFGAEDQDLRTTAGAVTPKTGGMDDNEQKLIEASAHDEDLRTLMMRPRSHTNESNDNNTNNSEPLVDDRSQSMASDESQSKTLLAEVPHNLPKVARDLYIRMQNKILNESESKSGWNSDSDDDDREVLTAALKNVQQSGKHSASDKTNINISKMLSAIRHSSNPSAVTQSPKQSEFWQNILSGIHLASAGGSPSGNSTPPRTEYRDPRLKRGKDSMSPQIDTTPPVKICDPNVKIEYKLWTMKAPEIDYSTYVSIYRIDARLKNDPRLQKFFSKLPNSEIDNLSRIVPPPLKTAPVTPLSVLKMKKKSEKERKDRRDKANADSSALPPLPPLTISPLKSAPTPGIFPPTPPPIMSPLELISSRPTFTVSADTKPLNLDILEKTIVNMSKCEDNDNQSSESNDAIKVEPKLSKSPQSASSPERPDNDYKIDTKQIRTSPSKHSSADSLTSSTEPELQSPAIYLPPISSDIKPVFYSTNTSLPPLTSISSSFTSNSLSTQLFDSTFDSNLDSDNSDIKSEKDDHKLEEQMETASNYSTEDDLYDNMYPSAAEVTTTAATDAYNKKLSQNPITSSSAHSIEDELELIRNELKTPAVSVDSDTEMEIDLRQRKDSVSEVESADECELMIASASETEDNIDSDLGKNENNVSINTNFDSIVSKKCNNNNVFIDKPMDLSVSDGQNTDTDVDDTDINDLSLKSVFSTIDPTASPFC